MLAHQATGRDHFHKPAQVGFGVPSHRNRAQPRSVGPFRDPRFKIASGASAERAEQARCSDVRAGTENAGRRAEVSQQPHAWAPAMSWHGPHPKTAPRNNKGYGSGAEELRKMHRRQSADQHRDPETQALARLARIGRVGPTNDPSTAKAHTAAGLARAACQLVKAVERENNPPRRGVPSFPFIPRLLPSLFSQSSSQNRQTYHHNKPQPQKKSCRNILKGKQPLQPSHSSRTHSAFANPTIPPPFNHTTTNP